MENEEQVNSAFKDPGTLANRAPGGVRPRLGEEVRQGEDRTRGPPLPLANQIPSCFEDWLQEDNTAINLKEQIIVELIIVCNFIRSIHKNTHGKVKHCCLLKPLEP